MTDEKCPVCQAEFGNPGALGTHISLTKDADHVAHRAGIEAPSPEAPALSEAAPASPALLPASPEPLLRLASGEAPNREAAFPEAGEAGRQGETGTRGEADTQVILLPSPLSVEPLLPPGDSPGQAGTAPKAPPVSVPLEPILAGTVAISLNALFLSKPGDGKLTPEKVTQTGFPRAVEGSLRLYFPELPLDHPITALIASSAGLAMAVVELKAKAPAEPPAQATPQATVQAAPAPVPASEARAPASTGDPYWDTILRNAGGIQA